MPAYVYKAHINYEREKVRTPRSHEFDACQLSISALAPLVGDNIFSVSSGKWGETCTVYWAESRDETDDEYNKRIARLEAYNAEVDRRKAQEKTVDASHD